MPGLRLTEDEYAAIQAQMAEKMRAGSQPTHLPPPYESPKVAPARPLYRSKLEAEFALRLDAMRQRGTFARWEFEGITLRLGHDCRYTPDFVTFHSRDGLAFFEVKGRKRWDDAMVKLRTAATKYPEFEFWLAEKEGGAWNLTLIPSTAPRAVHLEGEAL